MGLSNKNPYTWAGLCLLITGSLISLLAFFVLNLIWLTALGICMLILSFILITLGKTIPRLPPEICNLLLSTGIDNISSVVEELGIKAKAVYLPSSLNGGRPRALIPLHSNPTILPPNNTFPHRLIVRYGTRPDDIGLLLSTLGTAALGMLESKPGPTPDELESALNTLFSGILGVADKASVTCNQNHIHVEIHNARIENETDWSHYSLGGPIASIVATAVAEAWNNPVAIKQEKHHKKKHFIELEVLK